MTKAKKQQLVLKPKQIQACHKDLLQCLILEYELNITNK